MDPRLAPVSSDKIIFLIICLIKIKQSNIMTIEAGHVTSLYSHDIFFGFILVDYQTGL